MRRHAHRSACYSDAPCAAMHASGAVGISRARISAARLWQAAGWLSRYETWPGLPWPGFQTAMAAPGHATRARVGLGISSGADPARRRVRRFRTHWQWQRPRAAAPGRRQLARWWQGVVRAGCPTQREVARCLGSSVVETADGTAADPPLSGMRLYY